jgi:hypothetical protein
MVTPSSVVAGQRVERGHPLLPLDRPQVDATELVAGLAAGIDHHQAPISVQRQLGPRPQLGRDVHHPGHERKVEGPGQDGRMRAATSRLGDQANRPVGM